MIIEDDTALKKGIAEELIKWGHNINEIINLPFYDGFHWCNEIRKISKIPIIFMSSRSSNMDIIMGVNLGDFIKDKLALLIFNF